MNTEHKRLSTIQSGVLGIVLLCWSIQVSATVVDVTVDGSDAIFLAGRTDLVIPAANLPWPGGMIRHASPTPEEVLETLPPIVSVSAGDVVRVLDPAVGGINFYNGFGPPYFGPDGGGSGQTNLNAFGGISGFLSDGLGPLVGVFLSDAIPNGTAPDRLNFTNTGIDPIGTNFLTLTPDLGQVFFVGDGVTSSSVFQEFTAPVGATRLALGIPDGFSFVGSPGAYDDNDGAYRVRIGINEVPTIAEPATLALLALGLAGISCKRGKWVKVA